MRLIDADALIKRIQDEHKFGSLMLSNVIADMPSAERKAEWIEGIGENGVTISLFCSNCNYENRHWYEWNFCPNCGAKMEDTE